MNFRKHAIINPSGEIVAAIADNGHDVLDQHGERVGVYFDMESYNELLERLEDLEDIRDAYAAKYSDDDVIPFEQVFPEIEPVPALQREVGGD